MKKIYDAIIIGTGAAGYGVADWLYKENIDNILILAENRLSGTSRNTGSDKQTYYKLSMDGFSQDCPYNMATDLFSGGCTDGEKAYLQAVYSTVCFLRLYEYGVSFPRDEYGGFPGYKTDHDNTTRATSIGPLTSKMMTECLEKKVLEDNKTPLLDNRQVVEIITFDGSAVGVSVLNKKTQEFEFYCAKNIICATGAPACIYEKSVYPQSQHGMSGIISLTGVSFCNLTQWQYGLSSTDFRWNVSGSFMQVIPRFVSVDKNGEEKEFLPDYFSNSAEAYSNTFLKGYQWPFCVDRIENSSKIDIAVHNEIKKGNKVYLDFTKNPAGFVFDELSAEAKDYLLKNDVNQSTPIQRLEKLNRKAIDVYAKQDIDLYTQKLQIAVCAQHNNGGVHTDNNYETQVKGLYVIGEAAGTFGITRPGGSALNDTQVGGLLCAKHIASKENPDLSFEAVHEAEKRYGDFASSFVKDSTVDYSHIPSKMSASAAFMRDNEECKELLREVSGILKNLPLSHKSLSDYFYDYDMLLSAKMLLEAILDEMPSTGSRGSALFISDGKTINEDKSYRQVLSVSKGSDLKFIKAKSVPKIDRPFEQYLNKTTQK